MLFRSALYKGPAWLRLLGLGGLGFRASISALQTTSKYFLYYRPHCVKFVQKATQLAENHIYLFLIFVVSKCVSLLELYVLDGFHVMTYQSIFVLFSMCCKYCKDDMPCNAVIYPFPSLLT